MCYKVVLPRTSATPAEYVCPTCQQKTLFERDLKRFDEGTAGLVEKRLPIYRQRVKKLQELKASVLLDEAECCWHRTKDLKKVQTPKIYLLVKHHDGTVHRTVLQSEYDFSILHAFYSGRDRVADSRGGETALKSHLPRLFELLGVSETK